MRTVSLIAQKNPDPGVESKIYTTDNEIDPIFDKRSLTDDGDEARREYVGSIRGRCNLSDAARVNDELLTPSTRSD